MKKLIIVLSISMVFTIPTEAQVQFGIKAGVNYNAPEDLEVVTANTSINADSKLGYHAGLWTKIKIPAVGLFVRPEVVYTQLKSEFNSTSYDLKKIDVPVLLGKNIFKIASIYLGPSLQYIIDSELDINDVMEVDKDDFSLGMQVGLGIEIGKLGLDLRWERGFSETEAKFLDNVGNDFTVDNRTNQIIFGASYRF